MMGGNTGEEAPPPLAPAKTVVLFALPAVLQEYAPFFVDQFRLHAEVLLPHARHRNGDVLVRVAAVEAQFHGKRFVPRVAGFPV